jgi:hypothetical protein
MALVVGPIWAFTQPAIQPSRSTPGAHHGEAFSRRAGSRRSATLDAVPYRPLANATGRPAGAGRSPFSPAREARQMLAHQMPRSAYSAAMPARARCDARLADAEQVRAQRIPPTHRAAAPPGGEAGSAGPDRRHNRDRR